MVNDYYYKLLSLRLRMKTSAIFDNVFSQVKDKWKYFGYASIVPSNTSNGTLKLNVSLSKIKTS